MGMICTCSRPLVRLPGGTFQCRSCGRQWERWQEGGENWLTLIRDPHDTWAEGYADGQADAEKRHLAGHRER